MRSIPQPYKEQSMNFDSLKQDRYHHVACGPFEKNTSMLVGSDIVLHLPVLEYYASLCEHVTEFGVRDGHSTIALIAGCKGQVASYDIQRSNVVDVLEKMDLPCKWSFRELDTGDPWGGLLVEPTEMLFIDTLHIYGHVKKELAIHGRKATKFLAFHDTFTCGERDLSGPNPNAIGILPAIREFLSCHPGEYETVYRTDVCNGLWILKRI